MKKILVVDDQKTVCYSVQRFLQSEGYEVLTATSGEAALGIVSEARPDLVVMDVRMPEMDGIEALRRIKETHPKVQVIMMTAFSTTEKAIEAIKMGAYEYIIKPFDNNELLRCVQNAIRTKELSEEVICFDGAEEHSKVERIVGKSRKMLAIYKQIGRVAPTDATVLIRGESGTGKELIARAIYQHSKRAQKPFLPVNCASIPDNLLEAELFGYERGAFTGADFRRIGKFEQYDGGTIFLDELGDMSLQLQAKVLRVLQDGTFQMLGGTGTVKTDVRIIAATNRDLDEMVRKGTFREDLYYRLNVVSIEGAPLRERTEDIRELAHYFIQRYSGKFGKTIKGLTPEALKILEEHQWPGNVREMENAIQKAIIFCDNDYLSEMCFDTLHAQSTCCVSIEEAVNNLVEMVFKDGCQERFQDIVRTLEAHMVKRAMELTRGNQVHAAKLLGISRTTLRKKIEEHPQD